MKIKLNYDINDENENPELCEHAQTINDDIDFYCHKKRKINKCDFYNGCDFYNNVFK